MYHTELALDWHSEKTGLVRAGTRLTVDELAPQDDYCATFEGGSQAVVPSAYISARPDTLGYILEAVWKDGQTFKNFSALGGASQIPSYWDIGDLEPADNEIFERLKKMDEGENGRPASVWMKLQKNAYAAGIQDKPHYSGAIDFFGNADAEEFKTRLDWIRGLL